MHETNMGKTLLSAVVAIVFLCAGTGLTMTACGGSAAQAPASGGAWNPSAGPPPPPGGGSPSSPGPSAGCTKDTDCKGDRVCESGVCRAPG
jgi:hypothetical protein